MPVSRRLVLAGGLALPLGARAQSAPDAFVDLDAALADAREDATPRVLRSRVDLRIKKGEDVRLRLTNHLDQPAALHFQGVRPPNGMDGAAGLTQPALMPGGSFDYRFTPPDSGTFWYRASAMPAAPMQRALGLYGLLIVEEPNPPDADADLPIVFDDRIGVEKSLLNGAFLDPALTSGQGRMGPGAFVNRAPAPASFEQRPGSRLRLRLLNASNAQFIAIVFDNLNPRVLAIDGQPCDPFEPARATLPLGPGARFDVIVDLPADPEAKAGLKLRGQADSDLVAFVFKGEPRAARAPVNPLAPNPLLPTEIKLQNAKRLDILIEGPTKDPARIWTLNGGAGAIGAKPLFQAARGQPVTLGFENKTPVVQCLHVHGHVLRILHALDDGWEPYWRDSVIIPPGRKTHVAFVADNPGKWLVESAILDHAATGASGWFQVG